jgi:diguanylate cyclase (GGDEF)-like protein
MPHRAKLWLNPAYSLCAAPNLQVFEDRTHAPHLLCYLSLHNRVRALTVTGRGMSAIHDAIGRRHWALRRLGWPWSWSLLCLPWPLISYVLAVIAADVAFVGWEAARTDVHASDVALFVALMACGGICVEATRRLGQPSGMSRDMLSAWWLPVALLLPPIYATGAPVILSLVMHLRVRRTPVYRRAFSSAALGLAGATASVAFRTLVPAAYGDTHTWVLRPTALGAAAACAVLFSVLNTAIVVVAAHLAEPDIPLKELILNRENLLLDITEICVGVLVTISTALSPLLLVIALPPAVLLQRSLMHAQLKAAARTDAKTGLLNAVSWQREADNEITRCNQKNDPVSVLLIDVDHFKRVNDGHGHLAGDDVLKGLAAELRAQVRETDIVGRFGGEEFVVLLPSTAENEACKIAERLRRSAAVVNILSGEATVGVTVSIGVAASNPIIHRDLFELLAAADLALYRAKADGRNRVRVYEPEADATQKTA